MHYPHIKHPQIDTSLFIDPSSNVQQPSPTSGMNNQEASTSISDSFTARLSLVPTRTASDVEDGQPPITSTSGTEIEEPSSTRDIRTVPLTTTPTIVPTFIAPSQPAVTGTIDIDTVPFQYPWESTTAPSPAPSTLLTAASPSLAITVPTSSPSPTPPSSLSGGAIAGITIGAILAAVFGGAALVFYLYRKNEKRVNDLEMDRVEGREDGDKVDLSPGA